MVHELGEMSSWILIIIIKNDGRGRIGSTINPES